MDAKIKMAHDVSKPSELHENSVFGNHRHVAAEGPLAEKLFGPVLNKICQRSDLSLLTN